MFDEFIQINEPPTPPRHTHTNGCFMWWGPFYFTGASYIISATVVKVTTVHVLEAGFQRASRTRIPHSTVNRMGLELTRGSHTLSTNRALSRGFLCHVSPHAQTRLSSNGDPTSPAPGTFPHRPRGVIRTVADVMSASVPGDPSRRHVFSSRRASRLSSGRAFRLSRWGRVRLFRTGRIGSASEAIFPTDGAGTEWEFSYFVFLREICRLHNI